MAAGPHQGNTMTTTILQLPNLSTATAFTHWGSANLLSLQDITTRTKQIQRNPSVEFNDSRGQHRPALSRRSLRGLGLLLPVGTVPLATPSRSAGTGSRGHRAV